MSGPGKARAAHDTESVDVDFSERNGFMSGKALALADWSHRKEVKQFTKLVNVLRVAKWSRENPERRRRNSNAYAAKPESLARQRVREKKMRIKAWKPDTTVRTCVGCGTQWCRVIPKIVAGVRGRGPGNAPKFCTAGCWRRWEYQQKRSDPAFVAANRAKGKAQSEKRRLGAKGVVRLSSGKDSLLTVDYVATRPLRTFNDGQRQKADVE